MRKSTTGRRRAWSLARKLPLLMTGLLAVLLATTLALTYVTLTRSAMTTAEERLQRAGNQLGSVLVTGVGQMRTRLSRAAADTTLRRVLAAQAAAGDSGDDLRRQRGTAAPAGLDEGGIDRLAPGGRRPADGGGADRRQSVGARHRASGALRARHAARRGAPTGAGEPVPARHRRRHLVAHQPAHHAAAGGPHRGIGGDREGRPARV